MLHACTTVDVAANEELTDKLLIIGNSMSKQIFVSPTKEGWKAKTVGADRAAGIFETKAEAVERAIQIAIHNQLELMVQNRDGKIGWRNSYGNDPRESKG